MTTDRLEQLEARNKRLMSACRCVQQLLTRNLMGRDVPRALKILKMVLEEMRGEDNAV